MLRLAIYYDNECSGRNDGNPVYVLGSLKRMQEKKLLEVDHIVPKGDLQKFGTYDAHIWVDWGEDGLGNLIHYKMLDCPKPNIYWASDTHINNGLVGDSYPYRLEMAKKFDYVFAAQKRGVEEFASDGVKAEWLPHAVEPLAYCDPDTGKPFVFGSKKYDVCFVGHINSGNRIEFLDSMFREFPNFFYGQRLFNEAAEKYAQSKICLNISMTDDLNMRTFEIMGAGAFCLTSWIPTIEEHFEDGKHLALYRSVPEAVDKAKYYLSHDSEREKIAQAGYEEVMAKHTIDHRTNKILEAINKLTVVESVGV
jgi:spore maturation protein CgeB